MAVHGVIFDFGGTLIHLPSDEHGQAFLLGGRYLRRFLRTCGIPPSQVDAVAAEFDASSSGHRASGTLRQLTVERNLARCLRHAGARLPARHVGAAALVFLLAEFGLWRPVPGAGDLLAALRAAGLRVGLCSNTGSHAYVAALLAAHDLERHLDPIVTSAGVGWRKPDRRAFTPLLAAWDLPPEDVAMVGDDLEADIAGGAALGMRTVWLPAFSRSDRAAYTGPAPWRTAPDLPAVARCLGVEE